MRTISPSVTRLLSLLLLSTIAVAQKTVPPPPKPADSGPSLEVTMKFIQDKLNEQGTFNYVLFIHDDVAGNDWTNRWVSTQTGFMADPGSCRVNFHWKQALNGATTLDGDLWFLLKSVKSLSVMTYEQDIKIVDTDGGYAGRSYRSDPSFFVLLLKAANRPYALYFHDEDTADRVAKALTHAVELCGGGENDPF